MSDQQDREIQWVIGQYPVQANHPMFPSREREFSFLKQLAERYSIDLTMEVFEAGIAERFGSGCEYEWARD